ncbi:MAG: LLM class flavin-dependent oxidoreductase, partial [Streptomyces sp.]|nr:LLM class flavin-dependent oxidoreductase [Streptomyces sp.]
MTDYGHPLSFGVSLDPAADALPQTRELARLADARGLAYIAVQDHPYQPGHLETWTLITHLADATDRISAVEPLLGIGEVLGQQAHLVPYAELVSTAHLHANTGQMRSLTTSGLLPRITPDAARALVEGATGRHPALIQLRSLGGATHDPAPDDTAFPHRHQRTMAVASVL